MHRPSSEEAAVFLIKKSPHRCGDLVLVGSKYRNKQFITFEGLIAERFEILFQSHRSVSRGSPFSLIEFAAELLDRLSEVRFVADLIDSDDGLFHGFAV